MLTCAIDDEPSMEGILAEVRRILLREEAARRAPAEDHGTGEALLLTDMIGADGSLVRIAPDTKGDAALGHAGPARDPYAKLDALRSQVAALLGTEAEATRSGGANRRPACPDAPAETVSAATLSQDVIVADGGHSPAARAVSLRPAGRPPALAGAADGAAAHTDYPPHGPAAEIERMLAQQMAAAHRAVMMLTDAALERIHEEAGEEERPAGARAGVRVVGRRRRGEGAARLANSAVRMMRAYNATLATLMSLGGEAAKSMASRRIQLPEEKGGGAQAKRPRRRLGAGPPRGKHASPRASPVPAPRFTSSS